MDREIYMTALRVLSRFGCGETQDEFLVAKLRRCGLAEDVDLPIDELCCRLININRYLSELAVWPRKSA
jgi:hypothetical protein